MGNFTFTQTGIDGLVIIDTKAFGDQRGYFMETWHQRDFAEGGIPHTFVQDNQSSSGRGVLRGLHFQKKNPQGKLVRVLTGCVYDVAVDLRKSSKTFGRWYGVELSAENKRQFYVPEGFAHGFLVQSETAEFAYKCTRFYDPTDEGGLLWSDTALGIAWPIQGDMKLSLSQKDQNHPELKDLHFWYE